VIGGAVGAVASTQELEERICLSERDHLSLAELSDEGLTAES
jgi:hypothetical protein